MRLVIGQKGGVFGQVIQAPGGDNQATYPTGTKSLNNRNPVCITVSWNGQPHSITLPGKQWERVLSGGRYWISGDGFSCAGKHHSDYWCFEGGLGGSLVVTYDGCITGFEGKLGEADIEALE